LSLPHRFPFRIVHVAGERRVVVRWSAGDWWLRGAPTAPIGLLVEAAAQAAGELLAPTGAAAEELRLAGVDGASVEALPGPGESWEVEARIEARRGGLTRVAARFLAGGREAGRATLVLAGGG
jgi:3-hydroxymyristoyl/3-hydroxydecanoyl-(acyl carrier protein) dehydratase